MYKIWFARNYRTHVANTLLLDNAPALEGAGPVSSRRTPTMRQRIHFAGCQSGLVGGVAVACLLFACGNKGPGFSGGTSGGGDDAAGGSSSSSNGSSGGASTSGGSGGSSGASSGSNSGGGSGSSSGGSGGSSRDSGANGDGGGAHSDSGAPFDASARVRTNVQYNDAGVPLCGTPCPLTSNICCVDQFGSATCHAQQGANCPLSAIFRCVDKGDCPGNQVCCGIADQSAATAGSECQDVSTNGNRCSPVATSASSTKGSAQLCQTDGECLSGKCLWQDCSVGTLSPSLTMCGLQSAAPFNCVAHP